MKNRICIDLGGTNIRVAEINENGEIISKVVNPTDPNNPEKNIVQICDIINGAEYEVSEVFMCSPGPLDENNTMMVSTPNLPGWNMYPFVSEIESKANVKVNLINDANAATLGEAKIHSQYESVLFFTISTGFGGGFAIGKNIYAGEYNTAFEIKDYIIEKPKNLRYGDLEGLEDFCSGTGIRKLANFNGLNIESAKEVFMLENENDIAKEIINFVKITITNFLRNVSYIINPGVIALGGSVILNNSDLYEGIKTLYYGNSDELLVKTKITLADEEGNSGLYGLSIYKK